MLTEVEDEIKEGLGEAEGEHTGSRKMRWRKFLKLGIAFESCRKANDDNTAQPRIKMM